MFKLFAATMAVLVMPAMAQTVTFNGTMSRTHAVLVIDGQPRTVAVGATVGGVKLISMSDAQAVVEVQGARRTLALGAGPVKASGSDASLATAVVLTAGSGGHFRAIGQINGKSLPLMVDTGASVVAMSAAQADSIGLDWRNGTAVPAQTANGTVSARVVTLNSVRLGDVTVPNIQAMVVPMPMSHVLLGNSFLSHFQMRRDNDVMRLEKR
jgi:aspartyl protease family protein